jgi:lysyl-tRNA synthetase, class II
MIDALQRERLKKLKNIQKLGVSPYPASVKNSAGKTANRILTEEAKKMLGKKVTVAGRLRSLRPHGKITFADLEDVTGKIQLFFSQNETGGGQYDFLPNLDLGDFILAEGEIFKTQAGEITVRVSSYQLLSKSLRPLPSNWYGLKDTEERLRRRYLDLLINPEVREIFVLKSKFWANIRKYMVDHGFMEVEAGVLEPIPGGADARPFITHMNALDIDLYLRISLELPLKKLLVGGFEKVFEIGRIFRNEGIDEEHLQDYTQLEFYWAFADYNQLMEFVQSMYQTIIKETFGKLKTSWNGHLINWAGKWPKVEYTDLLNENWKVDIDKMSVKDLYEFAKKLGVKVEPNLGKGRLLDYLYKKTIRPKLIQPMFVINHPVEVEPLAKRLENDPSKVQRMQVLAMGTELGKGFSELNDPIDQRERFEEQMRLRAAGDEEAQMMDEDYVEAMEYGMPPNTGFGISERLFSMLMDKPVRETTLFPLMKPEEKRRKK